MGDLQEAIDALKEGLGQASGVITLGLHATQSADGSWQWSLATGPTPHSVTLALGDAPAILAATPRLAAVPGGSGEAPASDLGRLDLVFGAPGFDSGARATVFRELASDVGEAGLDQLLALVQRGEAAGEAGLERARHGLERLLERGPSGAREAARILGHVLSRHGLGPVLEEVASRWRFGG